jgi:DNA-binding NarL/FixJ family response regulator
MKAINVAIADDHTMFRKILKNYLSEQKNINVVLQSSNLTDLLRKLKDHYVHILLINIHTPQLNLQDPLKKIRSLYPHTKILILSMCNDMDLLSELLDLDVSGYISRNDEPEDLLRAIIALTEHRIYRSQLFTEVLYWNKQYNPQALNGYLTIALNEREKEIIRLLWEEKSNKEIADTLFLSVRSVEKIKQDLKEKLGVKSTVGLLKYALNNKIIVVNNRTYSTLY